MRPAPTRLDLASGRSIAEGFDGVDQDPTIPGLSWVADLSLTPWVLAPVEHHGDPRYMGPLADASVEALHCSHFVEHVPDLVDFMNEAHRVLVPGGVFVIRHPYQFSLDAWQDPTHVRALNELSWWYYNAEWREKNLLDHYLGITADFDYVAAFPSVTEEYADATPEAVQRSMRKFVNVVRELRVELQKPGGGPDA